MLCRFECEPCFDHPSRLLCVSRDEWSTRSVNSVITSVFYYHWEWSWCLCVFICKSKLGSHPPGVKMIIKTNTPTLCCKNIYMYRYRYLLFSRWFIWQSKNNQTQCYLVSIRMGWITSQKISQTQHESDTKKKKKKKNPNNYNTETENHRSHLKIQMSKYQITQESFEINTTWKCTRLWQVENRNK